MKGPAIIRVAGAVIPTCLAVLMTLTTSVQTGAAAVTGDTQVVGSGVRAASSATDVPFTFSFDAASKAAPNGVYGAFSGAFAHDRYFRSGASAPGSFARFAGVVTCLRVNGREATIGGIITTGFGYDGVTTGDGFSAHRRGLAGDWYIVTARDPAGENAADTVGYVDWGDRTYFTTAGYGYTSFTSMCNNPTADLGTAQFPLVSGDLTIRH